MQGAVRSEHNVITFMGQQRGVRPAPSPPAAAAVPCRAAPQAPLLAPLQRA